MRVGEVGRADGETPRLRSSAGETSPFNAASESGLKRAVKAHVWDTQNC